MKMLGYKVTSVLPEIPASEKIIVNTINPHSYCVAKNDPVFQKALQKGDYLLPDGIGIVMAARLLKKKKIRKIAGYDVFIHFMEQLNKNGGTCFFLGSAPNTLNKIKDRVAKDYPNLTVHFFSPPYKPEFSRKESEKMFKEVNKINPDVLFVGMTAPKQEKWVYENQRDLNSKVICSIGAVFDFYAGTIKRPSKFWISIGLEWLPRFLKEPKRLAKRNLVSTPYFVWDVLKKSKLIGI